MSEEKSGQTLGRVDFLADMRKWLLQNAPEVKPILDASPRLIEILESYSKFCEGFSRRLQEFLDSDSLKQFSETLIRLKESNEIRARKYPNFAENLQEIARQGWFLSLRMGFSSYEMLAFSLDDLPESEGRWEALDEVFSSFYSEHIDYFLEELLKRYPSRGFAIRPAVNAHLRGEYALSVPVFFAQAEGILRDETEQELFTKINNVSVYAAGKRLEPSEISNFFLYFDDAIWAPLCGGLPITWGPAERKRAGYEGLNRNTTLHGIDLKYASEVNSLKSFSLLCYVAGLFGNNDR